MRLDPDTLEPRPYLARSWAWVDPLTLRVELREGVRFHSGAPFTARDVKATIAAFQSPEVGSRHARVVETIGQVDVDGEHAVVIHLARAHATLLTDLELPILRADEALSPPRPDGTLDGLGPYVVAHRDARRDRARAREGRSDADAGASVTLAPCTTRTRARYACTPGARTSS